MKNRTYKHLSDSDTFFVQDFLAFSDQTIVFCCLIFKSDHYMSIVCWLYVISLSQKLLSVNKLKLSAIFLFFFGFRNIFCLGVGVFFRIFPQFKFLLFFLFRYATQNFSKTVCCVRVVV